MPIKRYSRRLLAATALIAFAQPSAAQNIDVSTIPGRDTVQLTIYNSADLTLVRETRHITFRKGMNPLQFSWANTLIDPTSVDVRFRSHADQLDVLDTTYPHDKPQMLYWNVRSAIDGAAVIEVSYFTSGITWAADYVCIADAGEDTMSFDGFVRITNNSGEDYADAEVRLVVGEINLVETIAHLAQRGIISEKERGDLLRDQRAVRKLKSRGRMEMQGAVAGRMNAPAASAPKQIVKEGLSEYFIFTIPGTETVGNGWSKRMRLFEGLDVPFDVKYRYRPREYGDQLARLFILRNDEKSSLGDSPLPDGAVRLFRDNGQGGLSYLITHHTKYVPIGQEIELNLGRDPEVIHERIRLRSWRDEFWFRGRTPRELYSPTKGHRILPNYSMAGWDDHEQWIERIRNYRDEPIEVEVRRTYGGDVVFTSALDPTLHDFQTPQITATVAAATTDDLTYAITYKQGVNLKQNRVRLEDAP